MDRTSGWKFHNSITNDDVISYFEYFDSITRKGKCGVYKSGKSFSLPVKLINRVIRKESFLSEVTFVDISDSFAEETQISDSFLERGINGKQITTDDVINMLLSSPYDE